MNPILHFSLRRGLLAAVSGMLLSTLPGRLHAQGQNNTATGTGALQNISSGNDNTADGFDVLNQCTTGGGNTGVGFTSMFHLTGGGDNTAVGYESLNGVTTGNDNTATGSQALENDTTGQFNAAYGASTLTSNTTGNNNTALGTDALTSNAGASYNTALGESALLSNTTGGRNTAVGGNALLHATDGGANVAVGFNAGGYISEGSFNIDIGSPGGYGDGRTIRIGIADVQKRAFIAGISGVPVNGSTVVVDANGQLGVAGSSERFKDDVKDMSDASKALLALRPVSYRYKQEIDPAGQAQYGLIAEEVEKVDPSLVVHDADGKPFTVRYEQVNAMLLNEFLKEHAHGQAQDAEIAQLKAAMARQQAQFEALRASVRQQAASSAQP